MCVFKATRRQVRVLECASRKRTNQPQINRKFGSVLLGIGANGPYAYL